MKEDEVLMGLLEWVDGEKIDIEVEKRYNYYGDRGVVDLVITDHEDHAAWVIELKSDAAIKEVGGANDIIRQFNKHREFFFKGTDKRYNAKRNRRFFQLSFAATELCWQHLEENWSIYESLTSKHNTHVAIEHPDVSCTGYLFRESDFHEGWEKQHVFARYVDSIEVPDGIDSSQEVAE